MIIGYSRNFVLIHLQKTGGTSVSSSVIPYLEPYDLVIKDWTRLIFNREGDLLSEHATSYDVAKYLGDSWHTFNKVATVRNPISLVKSLYSYTSEVHEEHFKDSLEVPPDGTLRALRYSRVTDSGIDGFIDYLIARDYMAITPQSDRLGLMLDGTIVDLSRISEDWTKMTDAMGLPRDTPLLWENKSKSHDVVLSDATTKKIKKHFEKDYDILPAITGVNW